MDDKEEILKTVYIYLYGYRTGCSHSVRDWLEARDKVSTVGSPEWEEKMTVYRSIQRKIGE